MPAPRLLLLGCVWFTSALTIPASQADTVAQERLRYAAAFRHTVARDCWPAFAATGYAYKWVYYTPLACYVADPSASWPAAQPLQLVRKSRTVSIFKTASRLDAVPFHMETTIASPMDATALDPQLPIIKCSSIEEARQLLPQLSFDQWVAMVEHEAFHAFQFQHPAFRAAAQRTNTLNMAFGDSLQSLYRRYPWFKQAVDEENHILLAAIAAPTPPGTDSLLRNFRACRARRRAAVSQQLGLRIASFEQGFETFEGTARYVEAAALRLFLRQQPVVALRKADPFYQASLSSAATRYTAPAWLYDTAVSDRYFYATGYNMARALDKVAPAYQTRLFTDGPLTLEALVQERP